jgi:hypothetical protein
MTPNGALPWAILEFEKGRHTAIPNSLGRIGIACVIPMVTDYNAKARVEFQRPVFQNLAFVPGEERLVYRAMDLMYVEKVWRDPKTGVLESVPDAQLQAFMEGLARREKKPAKARRVMKLGERAESDWFSLYAALYGLQAAIKRFGRDLRIND